MLRQACSENFAENRENNFFEFDNLESSRADCFDLMQDSYLEKWRGIIL